MVPPSQPARPPLNRCTSRCAMDAEPHYDLMLLATPPSVMIVQAHARK